MSEYQMKRKKAIEHLNEQAKHLELIKKMVKQQKESGTPLFEGYKPRDGLESLLDASKVDENLEKKLVSIGARISVAKQWVQSLESPIKEYVLDRFPFFAKIFEKNYGIVSINNLNATFRLFNQQMMEQQKVVKKPSRESIMKILESANPEVRQRFLHDLIKSNKKVEKWFNRIPVPLGSRPSAAEVLNEFFNTFSNEIDAFAALSYVGSKLGLNFPTVEVTTGDDGDDSVFTGADSYTTPDSPSESSAFPADTMSTRSQNDYFNTDTMSTISDITSDENNRELEDTDVPALAKRATRTYLDELYPRTVALAQEDYRSSITGSDYGGNKYYTTIDPGNDEAVNAIAAMYSKENLLEFFESFGDSLPDVLYPGKRYSYRQAMLYVTRMNNNTRVKKLAELGFNFNTYEF